MSAKCQWESVILSHIYAFLSVKDLNTLQHVNQFLRYYVPRCTPIQKRLLRFLNNGLKVVELTNKHHGIIAQNRFVKKVFERQLVLIKNKKPCSLFTHL
jgi:hypothetical protein